MNIKRYTLCFAAIFLLNAVSANAEVINSDGSDSPAHPLGIGLGLLGLLSQMEDSASITENMVGPTKGQRKLIETAVRKVEKQKLVEIGRQLGRQVDSILSNQRHAALGSHVKDLVRTSKEFRDARAAAISGNLAQFTNYIRLLNESLIGKTDLNLLGSATKLNLLTVRTFLKSNGSLRGEFLANAAGPMKTTVSQYLMVGTLAVTSKGKAGLMMVARRAPAVGAVLVSGAAARQIGLWTFSAKHNPSHNVHRDLQCIRYNQCPSSGRGI